jgi:catechol 2,3-dioxygenase-like lactoylglutathione lyase family enzyme
MAPGAPTGPSNWRGIEHLNMTVADLDEATEFFTDVFGCQTLYTMGPFGDTKGPFIRVIANADVRSVVHHVRVLRSPRLNIELFRVTTPRQRPIWPDLLDIGGWALSAAVEDLGPAVAYLRDKDLYELGPGRYMTPWGLHFEVVEASPQPAPDWRPRPGSLPGFRGFESMHVTVSDLDEAGSLFEEVLGFSAIGDSPAWSAGGEAIELAARANVDARVQPGRARRLRSPYLDLELVECPSYPGQNRVWPAMFDLGGWHLAFYVDDIDAACEAVLGRDVHVLGRKKPAYLYEAGDEAYTLHCLAPFGLYFELVTYPHGRYREGEYAGPAWHPGRRAGNTDPLSSSPHPGLDCE